MATFSDRRGENTEQKGRGIAPTMGSAASDRRRHRNSVPAYDGGGPPAAPPKDSSEDKQKVVENERWKYLATWLNTMAAGTILVGILTPVFHVLAEGVDKAPPIDVLTIGGYFLIVLSLAVCFHLGALAALGNLRP